MLDGAIVEVAIGLALIFFVFSVAVSGIYEAVAKVLAWRAKSLWGALHVMFTDAAQAKSTKAGQRLVNATPLGDARPLVGSSGHMSVPGAAEGGPADASDPGASSSPGSTRAGSSAAKIVAELYAHPFVGGLEQRASTKRTRIDKIEPSSFARALIDTLAPEAGPTISVDDWLERVTDTDWVPEDLKRQLAALAREANKDFTKLTTNIETWFDAQMTTLSRHYRRRARYFTLAFGLIVAVGCNVDAVDAMTRLYRDDVVRAALVSQADTIAAGCDRKVGDELTTCLDEAADRVSRGATLPVGWANADLGVRSLPGWLLAGIAIAQGAPFWFDILKRTTNYRRSRVERAST